AGAGDLERQRQELMGAEAELQALKETAGRIAALEAELDAHSARRIERSKKAEGWRALERDYEQRASLRTQDLSRLREEEASLGERLHALQRSESAVCYTCGQALQPELRADLVRAL